MPLIFQKKEKKDFHLGTWLMEEEPEELLQRGVLSEKDALHVHSFNSIARRKEWICTRLLLSEMMPGLNLSIAYDENGKPHLQNSTSEKEISSYHISVSHTKNFVGLIVSEKYPVGIDIEVIHPRIEKIVHRFISEDELRFIPQERPLPYYFIIWGAKESLYKMYGRKELLFKEHLLVKPFDFNNSGEIEASIRKEDFNKEFRLNYLLNNELLTVYGLDTNP
jgi:4'-phosphopantetheinyl transferase